MHSQLTRSRRHSNIHTGKGPRFPCKEAGCEIVSRWKKDLLRHIKTHNKHLPRIRCAVAGCDSKFLRRDNYRRHLRTQHKGSRMARAILEADIRLGRRPNLPQEPEPSASESKESAIEAGTPMTESYANDSQHLVLPEQRQAPALSYPGALSVPGPGWVTSGASASMKSHGASLFTPSNAGSTSMFDDEASSPGPAPSYQVMLSGPESDWMTHGTSASMASQNASLFTSSIPESMSMFDDFVFSPGPESPFSGSRE